MINRLIKLLNYHRLWLTVAFVIGLVRAWLEHRPDSLSFWIGAVFAGVLVTVATAAALELLDKHSQRLSTTLAIVIVASVSLINLLPLSIALLLSSTAVVGSSYISQSRLVLDFQERIQPCRFPSSQSRIPFASVASMFSRRHGPYALYNLSCCLLN
jgi:hypothetical protein